MSPTVSSIRSPTCILAKELTRILTPYQAKPIHSDEVCHICRMSLRSPRQTQGMPNQLWSYQSVVKARLTKDPILMDRATITVPQLVELLSCVLDQHIFSFIMNSLRRLMAHTWAPPIPITANLFMEELEEKALQ